LLASMGAPMRTGQITAGLFGAINVQPRGAEWYRSQVTQKDLDMARDLSKGNNGFTTQGQPIINYNAVYPPNNPRAGKPILKMLDNNNNIVHTDLTALITGPASNGFVFVDNGEGVFRPNPSYSGKTNPPTTPPYPPRTQP